MKKFQHYIVLYIHSLRFVWQSSKKQMIYMLLFVPLQALLPAINIYVTNILIDEIASSDGARLSWLLILWGGSFFLNNVVSPLVVMVQGTLTDALTYQLNAQLMQTSATLQDIHYFEDSQFYNDIQLLSSEASWRPVNLLVFGTSLLTNTIMFASMLVVFASIHLLISMLLLLVLIPQGILSYKVQQQAFETLVSNSEESRKLDYYSQVLLSHRYIKDVRLYNLYAFFMDKYRRTFRLITGRVQGDRRKKFLYSAAFLSFSGGIILSMFFYIVHQIVRNQLGIGVIVVFTTSIFYAVNSMSRMVEDSSLLYDTLLYMERFFRFIGLKENIKPSLPSEKQATDSFIVYKDVNFSYPNASQLALKDITIEVKRGEKIAIVGENGAGKTTLIKLLCAFYSSYTGEIWVDGQSLRDYQLVDYRKKIASIFQDFSTFDMSLRENVALSDIERVGEEEKIRQALEKGRFQLESISLDQMLGNRFEDGKELSGGEWQKIALSRAFFSEAPILILDEPTAAIDARAEYELFQDFLQLTKDKTVFYITHRLASVKLSDKVLVLKAGTVHSFGTHQELMKSDTYYKELYAMQSSMYRDGNEAD